MLSDFAIRISGSVIPSRRHNGRELFRVIGLERFRLDVALRRQFRDGAQESGFIRAAKAIAKDGSFEGFEGSVTFAELNDFFREDIQKRSA